ncbi:MAG: carboxypeptidase-like regulatory domain-containing protein [Planctomycetaceae bacterium]|nr:carboxypeptidase-like regulatory domain-containing protein [Planctomycetaceae bacterium]
MTKSICRVFSFLLIFAALFIAGCKDKMGGSYPMTIKVTQEGNALEGATVFLIQLTGDGQTAVGVTNASGIAAIKSTEGWEGVFPGEYTVTIKKTEYSTSSTPPPGTEVDRSSSDENVFSVSRELLPAKYGNARTSEMKVMQEKKKGYFEFDLDKE